MIDMAFTLDLTEDRRAICDQMSMIDGDLESYGWYDYGRVVKYRIYLDGKERTTTFSCDSKELYIKHNQEFWDITAPSVDELVYELLRIYCVLKNKKVQIVMKAIPENGLIQTERYIMCDTQDFMKKEDLCLICILR